MNDQELAELQLEISAEDASEEDIDQMTRQLLSELREMDVESAELAKGNSAPAGTKSADPITAGSIALAVLPNMLPKVIEALQAWVMRSGNNRTIKFKGKVAGQMIEFEGTNADFEKILEKISKGKNK